MWSISISDIDNDGVQKLVGAVVGGDLLVFPRGAYSGQLPAPQSVDVAGGQTMYLRLADLNADGLLDCVVSFWDNKSAAVLLQESSS
jgi:hypothetical protein